MAGKNLHVIPHDKKWAIQDEGSVDIKAVYATKREAIDAARDLARSRKVTVVVHGRNGQPLLKTEAPRRMSDDEIRKVIRSGTASGWRDGSR